MASISSLTDRRAVERAIAEFKALGRTAFLQKHGFGKSREYMIRDPESGDLFDSKAVAGVAYNIQYSDAAPLTADDFSGGESTVQKALEELGFDVVRIGADWSEEEVHATVSDYFQMLHAEANGTPYVKSEHNAALRRRLQNRSKGSIEMKHQNISSVLDQLGLPYISGYKPRGNFQGMLREAVEKFVVGHTPEVERIVNAFEEAIPPQEKRFEGVLVAAPIPEPLPEVTPTTKKIRIPRKVDFAARDGANRTLGRAGEEWTIGYEKHRLAIAGHADLAANIDWIADRLGDGAGYDIASWTLPETPRNIEVKTTNGGISTPFVVTKNEVEVSAEMGAIYHLYRVFSFRREPRLYVLQGDLRSSLSLEPLDYRARVRALT